MLSLKRICGVPLVVAWAILGEGATVRAQTPAAADGAQAGAVFELRETSALESGSGGRRGMIGGARAICRDDPHPAVLAYPALRSPKPVYGLLRLAPDPKLPESGTPLYFVVDESGETPEAIPSKEEKKADDPSLVDRLRKLVGGSDSAQPEAEVVPLHNTYDRLYVDVNGDLDLTNDPVIAPAKNPPASVVRRYSGLQQAVVFDELAVPLDFGPGVGSRSVRLLPRLEIQDYEGKTYPGVEFISVVQREGDISIGNRQYHAVLSQRYVISGRYDTPYTQLDLTASDNSSSTDYWWGADQLNAMRQVGDQYFTTSVSPVGDKLTVKPYQGDFGTLQIGAGNRTLNRVSIQGSLETRDTVLAVGAAADATSGGLLPVSECRLPVGDYIPNYVTIEYGHLRLSISQNYHGDGKPRNIDRSAWSYGIKIRKDETFVWDFSNAPEVMFANPAKDQTFKRGDQVTVAAVLIDPKLTIMIRGLTDADRKETKSVDLGGGQTSTYETQASLDPIVTITNSAGKQIAEGPMPFG